MNCSLKPFNTFAIEAYAEKIVLAESVEQILNACHEAQQAQRPTILLGEGSNCLFLADFDGWVIVNRLKGMTVTEQSDHWLLHVGAGENWHQLVVDTLQRNIPGLENLAMIPGCVGSSPIQNIGAYGRELKEVCRYVDVVDITSGNSYRLTAEECQFGYRDSIFKHPKYKNYVIVAVGFVLPKAWTPILTYGDLIRLDPTTVTAQQIFDCVCAMRSSKLPDPKRQGNAGSFFKNPVISSQQAAELHRQHPHMPCYPQADGQVKLAAGWLIDQCQLKGHAIGGAAVHQQQALVIINTGQATGKDVVALAAFIRQQVGLKFDVWLEPEVRFIAQNGEVSALEAIA